MTEREAGYLHSFRKPTFPISKHGALFFPCDAPSVLLQLNLQVFDKKPAIYLKKQGERIRRSHCLI